MELLTGTILRRTQTRMTQHQTAVVRSNDCKVEFTFCYVVAILFGEHQSNKTREIESKGRENTTERTDWYSWNSKRTKSSLLRIPGLFHMYPQFRLLLFPFYELQRISARFHLLVVAGPGFDLLRHDIYCSVASNCSPSPRTSWRTCQSQCLRVKTINKSRAGFVHLLRNTRKVDIAIHGSPSTPCRFRSKSTGLYSSLPRSSDTKIVLRFSENNPDLLQLRYSKSGRLVILNPAGKEAIPGQGGLSSPGK